MILFACQCGAPYSVEDQYAGGTLECTACSKANRIPGASDPRVVLIFRAGESEAGVPMLREEVERLVAAGEFTEAELIWDGTTWRPVTQVMGGGVSSEDKPKFHLKRRENEVEEKEEELAFDGIEPIQKVQLDEADLQNLPATKREKKEKKEKLQKKVVEKKKEAPKEAKPKPATKADGGSTPGGWRLYKQRVFGNDPSLGPKVNIPIKAFWFLVVVFYGFKMGLGPLFSKLREKPTYVVVYNTSGQECVATLGWRRLKRDIFPGTSACFEVYVGMTEKQKLTLTTKATGDTVATARVPLWPGGLSVVNPFGAKNFAQIRPGQAREENLPAADLKQLAEQVGSHQEPSAFLRLAPEGRRIARKALVGTLEDRVFTSDKFRFEDSIVQGDTELRAKFLADLEKWRKDSKQQFDYIVWPPRHNVTFKEGRAMLDLVDEERIQMEIWLPKKSFRVGSSLWVTVKDNPKLDVVSGADGSLTLKMEFQNHTSKLGTAEYLGTWRYAASHAGGKWDWSWNFEGQNDRAPNGRRRVTYRYDRYSKESGPNFR